MVTDVRLAEAPVTSARTGSFGALTAEVATPLAMVLTELLQNATEHAFAERPGSRRGRRRARAAGRLRVTVADDGRGLPDGFDAGSVDQPGAVDRPHARGVRARRHAQHRPGAPGARHPGRGRRIPLR